MTLVGLRRGQELCFGLGMEVDRSQRSEERAFSTTRPAGTALASRYERAGTIVTSHKSLESWAEVFRDPVIASAVLDRLVHHAHLIAIVGESYRMNDLSSHRRKGGPAPQPA